MNTALKTVFAAALAAAAMAASAQPYGRDRVDSRDIDTRQARQEQRIQQGVERGRINGREARILRQGQREIARTEARAKADGWLSRAEARNLTVMLDQADARIQQYRHDRDGHRPA